MAFDVYTTHMIPILTCRLAVLNITITFFFFGSWRLCFAGDEIIRTNKRNEEDNKEARSRIASHTTSTIAEEAVDQLQASEKLIAGN